MKLLLIVSVFTGALAYAAPTCRIGCTVGCDPALTAKLMSRAKSLGLRLRLVNMARLTGSPSDRLGQIDGVLIPGGKDIDPDLYLAAVPPSARARVRDQFARKGKQTPESLRRDRFEYRLARAYFTNEKFRELPVLGVCYGMQMLAVANSLPLIVDINEEFGLRNRYDISEHIELAADSKLAAIMGEAKVVGMEQHHQAVDMKALAAHPREDLRITGTSNEGRIPEAIEFARRPALGVQFHPELSDPAVGERIFGWLLTEACAKARK